jgi:O-antigen ligase
LLISAFNLGIFSAKIHDSLQDFTKAITTRFVAQAAPDYKVSDTGFIRTGIWAGTRDLIFASPKNFLIGTGPETFPYYFQFFRPTELNFSSEWNFILNKPHNYFLEIWAETGLLGLLAQVMLLIYVFKTKSTDSKMFVLVFVVTNFFGWPTVATSLLFWIFLAKARIYEIS